MAKQGAKTRKNSLKPEKLRKNRKKTQKQAQKWPRYVIFEIFHFVSPFNILIHILIESTTSPKVTDTATVNTPRTTRDRNTPNETTTAGFKLTPKTLKFKI